MNTKTKPVEVVDYDYQWPEIFTKEASRIKKTLDSIGCLAVHHIGSTSVPGLAAKPVIDIIAVVQEPEKAIDLLETLGYTYKGEYNLPFRYFFSKEIVKDVSPKIHLHMYKSGNPEIELALAFRDYLRTHLDAVVEYSQLKAGLLTQKTSFEKRAGSSFGGYTLGKDPFIRKIISKTGFDKLRLTHCAHSYEWEQAKTFRKHFWARKDILFDPLTWTFNQPEHIHFSLYQGVKSIGYSHIQLLPDQKAILHMLELDHHCLNMRGQFLTLIETWLKQQKKCAELSLQTSPAKQVFYESLDYQALPPICDDDEENCPKELKAIGMHKVL